MQWNRKSSSSSSLSELATGQQKQIESLLGGAGWNPVCTLSDENLGNFILKAPKGQFTICEIRWIHIWFGRVASCLSIINFSTKLFRDHHRNPPSTVSSCNVMQFNSVTLLRLLLGCDRRRRVPRIENSYNYKLDPWLQS